MWQVWKKYLEYVDSTEVLGIFEIFGIPKKYLEYVDLHKNTWNLWMSRKYLEYLDSKDVLGMSDIFGIPKT